jgi:hypothetical protein
MVDGRFDPWEKIVSQRSSGGALSYLVWMCEFCSADSLEVLKSVDLSLPALPRLFVATNLDDSDIDNENSGASLDKICTQIVRLVHDPEKGIPLSRMNSHSLSIRTIGLVLIPPLLVTIGIIASRSKQGLKVYLKRVLEYLSFFSRCND